MHFIFDLHNTLISTRISHGQFLSSILPGLDSSDFDRVFIERMKVLMRNPAQQKIIWHLNGPSVPVSRSTWSDLFVDAACAAGCEANPEILLSACTASYDRLADPNQWFCYDYTLEVLGELVAMRHTISILSNFDRRGANIINGLLYSVPWRRIGLSFQTGLLKPDEGSFLAHCRLLDLPMEEIVMVGDDFWQDGGAERIGLKFRWVNHPSINLPAVFKDELDG